LLVINTVQLHTGLHPGAIVLFHNNGSYTAAALPEIFSYAKQEGYEIVPISQLLYKDNFYIDNSNGAQKKRN
jgi:peptidoglycan/xylan/chitin deacetylase (PgdA/CDA1 family)